LGSLDAHEPEIGLFGRPVWPRRGRDNSSIQSWPLRESWYIGIVIPMKESKTTKALTLRLPVEQAEALEAVAGVDEVSINEEIRRAIAAHIEARRQDVEFRERLRASIERNREILERLAR
jgi:hypothetical protein